MDYSLKISYLTDVSQISSLMVNSESRTAKTLQLQLNLRSLINIANGIEFSQYIDSSLARVNRFDYLSQ